MAHTYDAIIVGGGPAGSAAAIALAGAGAKILVLDRRTFPRDKLCAGLLTWKTMDALKRLTGLCAQELLARGVVNHKASFYRIRHRNRILMQGEMFYPFHFARRSALDAFLLDHAASLGADIATGERAVHVDPLHARTTTSAGRTLKAAHIIGADGALSATRAAFPVSGRAWRANLGAGLEIFLPRDCALLRDGVHQDLKADFPTVYAGFIRAGYAWVFPHKDRVVIGLGGLNRASEGLFRQCFCAFLDFLGLPRTLAHELRAHPLPYGNFLRNPVYGKALLAGDAAGYVETLFGEGVYYALRSGELSGLAVAESLARGVDPAIPYIAGLSRDVFPELRYSRRLRSALFSSLRYGLAPILLFLRCGGNRLIEMVHGVRSFRLLLPRAQGPDAAA